MTELLHARVPLTDHPRVVQHVAKLLEIGRLESTSIDANSWFAEGVEGIRGMPIAFSIMRHPWRLYAEGAAEPAEHPQQSGPGCPRGACSPPGPWRVQPV